MSTAVVLPRRRDSVASKLRNAFIGISLFSLLAALVAITGFQVIGAAQDEVLDRTLPAALSAERLAQQGLAVVAATPGLLASGDQEGLDRESARIAAAGESLDETIQTLREHSVNTSLLGKTEETLDEIFANLTLQVSLVERRNHLTLEIERSAKAANDTIEALIGLLKPAIIDASVKVLSKTDEVRADLTEDGAVGRAILETFDRLADVDLFAVEQLTEMRFRAENIRNDIDSLLLSDRAEAVLTVRNELSIDLRDMVRATLDVKPSGLRQRIATALQSLSGVGYGDSSLVEAKLELLQSEQRLEELSRQNLVLAEALRQDVELLLAEAQGLITASGHRARQVLAWGHVIMVAIAASAFLAAIVIIWKYVLGDVASRIRRLARVTRDLAQGNLNVGIDVDGADELGEMADAVRIFKTNAADLRRSNAELEQFAYVASHDLKAPLRGVSNLATWIEQDIGDAMGSETQKHMSLLHGRIGRMERLLEDLLQYSRVGRQQVDVRLIDLNRVVPEIFKMVAPSEGFSLTIATPLPRFVTAQAPLEQVFRNLISNAIKHHDSETGTIEIGFETSEDVYEFWVEDDGPGIAPQYHRKVFNMFQTLRSRDEVEGSGMGLAMVKKIVTTLECDVSVESDPVDARGTRFCFTWPQDWGEQDTTARAA